MNGYPIHQNLSTSFVNLNALIRHLQDLQFTGSVKVELSSYEAEIMFTQGGRVQAREYDRLAGRISQGKPAFKRILARAREPFGRIHVLRTDAKQSAERVRKPFVDDRITANARRIAFGNSDSPAEGSFFPRNKGFEITKTARPAGVEAGALITEMLLTIEEGFRKGKLDFAGIFKAACEFVSNEHGFLVPEDGSFTFENDEVFIDGRVSSAELFRGIFAALDHIYSNMTGERNFTKVLTFVRHKLKCHYVSRRSAYARIGVVDRPLFVTG